MLVLFAKDPVEHVAVSLEPGGVIRDIIKFATCLGLCPLMIFQLVEPGAQFPDPLS